MSRDSQAPVSPSELAAALRRARAERGLGLEEAARQCLLSEAQAAGLESGDYRAFYAPEYARRAALRYAGFLGLDHLAAGLTPEDADAVPPGESPATAAPRPRGAVSGRIPVPVTPPRRVPVNTLILVAGALVVGALVTVLRPDSVREPPAPLAVPAASTMAPEPVPDAQPAAPPDAGPAPEPATAGIPAPAAEPAVDAPAPDVAEDLPVTAAEQASPAEPAAPRRSPRRIYVLAIHPTPLRVYDGSGRPIFSGNVPSGFSRSFEGDPPFRVEAASPDPLEVYYLGRRVRLLDSGGGRSAALVGEPAPAR